MITTPQGTPRLLLGATTLFWGAMSGNTLVGLVLALILESRHWLNIRWNFSGKSIALAWRVSVIITIAFAGFIWIDGNRLTVISQVFIWTPLLLFPLQFVQNFGIHDSIALRYLSFISKSEERELKTYEVDKSLRLHFANVYFISTILASGLGQNASSALYFIGLSILSLWFITARTKSRWMAISIITLFAAIVGFSGQIGILKLHKWALSQMYGSGSEIQKSPGENKTSIGSLGEIKQSSDILWRLFPEYKTAPPRLIRTAIYNRYRGVVWRSNYPSHFNEEEKAFSDLPSFNLDNENLLYLFGDQKIDSHSAKKNSIYRIRGSSPKEILLPIAGDTNALSDFTIFSAETNPLGTTRIYPEEAVIEGAVYRHKGSFLEALPFSKIDLHIPDIEVAGIHNFAEEIGLLEATSTQEKLSILRQTFTNKFTYTRYLNIKQARSTRHRPTAIETFLSTEKQGHCEYFATSSVLLLRAAGVPARYCIGYTVIEGDTKANEWIIRGTHGHAWVRVWLEKEQRWIDFDPTPSNWIAQETSHEYRLQWLRDFMQTAREDFFIWRQDSKNQQVTIIVSSILGLSIFIFVFRRLWKSKLNSDVSNYGFNKKQISTPLNDAERWLKKSLPPRKISQPLTSWIIPLTEKGVSYALLEKIIFLHNQLRFDSSKNKENQVNELRNLMRQLQSEIS